MKHLTPILCALVTAGFGYLTATTAAKRDADSTRYEARYAADSVRIAYLAEQLAEAQQAQSWATPKASSRRPRGGPVARRATTPADDPPTLTALTIGALARADSAARANPATATLPKRALAARIARGLR